MKEPSEIEVKTYKSPLLYSPGRFFAAVELKVLLAYIICNYDFKIEGKRPPNKFFSFSCLPDLNVELLFRVRVDAEKSFVNRRMEARD